MVGSGRRAKRGVAVSFAVALAVAGVLASAAGGARADARPPVLMAGNPSGIVFARDSRPGGGGGNPDLVYHGGAVMTASAQATAIFWGTSWPGYSGDKISGIDSFYTGVGGSSYLGTTGEYSGSSGGHVYNGLSYTGNFIDSAQASSRAPSTSTVLGVVSATLSANGKSPVENGYYPVYSDQPRGHANYCAWHSYGTCGGMPVQFAFFFSLDGDAGCDPQDTSGQHSQGLAALANVTAHELSEARSDPASPGAWYDSQGAENGDKCAWTFGAPLVSFTNGTQWKLQGEWSNAAYNAQNGYPNSSGYKGCLSGL